MTHGYTGWVIQKAVIWIISKVKDTRKVILAVLDLLYHLSHCIQFHCFMRNIAFHYTRLIQFFSTSLRQLQ